MSRPATAKRTSGEPGVPARLDGRDARPSTSEFEFRSGEKLAQQSPDPHDSIKRKKRFRQSHRRNLSRARRPDQPPEISPAVAALFAQFQDQAEVFRGFEIIGRTASETLGEFAAESGHPRIGRNRFFRGFGKLRPKHVLHQPETYAENTSDSQRARLGEHQRVVEGLSQSLGNVGKPYQPRPKMLGGVQA